ncbi:hypothetical protein QF030_002509 [Streptomyces rishiriensis]|uniref:Secreted protein n=1 Tax=Streptomyces rishiriensis TaxID=68264 RepID=A0ABU0NMJ7_STRRH|nr:hypothetical protein [Streptomyces rishiriensis]
MFRLPEPLRIAITAVPAIASAIVPVSSRPPSVTYVASVARPVQVAANSPVRAASRASRACSASAVSDIARKCRSRKGPTPWTRISGAAAGSVRRPAIR